MRAFVLGLTAIISIPCLARAGSDRPLIGFPPGAFAQTWTSLPTDRFQSISPMSASVQVRFGHAVPVEDAKAARLLDEAFASAADSRARRGIALNAMMTEWPQEQRTTFQKLREAEVAYAAGDEARAQRFAALVTRVVDGSGRSAAVDGSTSTALDTAYAVRLSREDDAARARTEAEQKAFVAYRDAFATFADGQSLGTGMNVAAELNRQRAADLVAEGG